MVAFHIRTVLSSWVVGYDLRKGTILYDLPSLPDLTRSLTPHRWLPPKSLQGNREEPPYPKAICSPLIVKPLVIPPPTETGMLRCLRKVIHIHIVTIPQREQTFSIGGKSNSKVPLQYRIIGKHPGQSPYPTGAPKIKPANRGQFSGGREIRTHCPYLISLYNPLPDRFPASHSRAVPSFNTCGQEARSVRRPDHIPNI